MIFISLTYSLMSGFWANVAQTLNIPLSIGKIETPIDNLGYSASPIIDDDEYNAVKKVIEDTNFSSNYGKKTKFIKFIHNCVNKPEWTESCQSLTSEYNDGKIVSSILANVDAGRVNVINFFYNFLPLYNMNFVRSIYPYLHLSTQFEDVNHISNYWDIYISHKEPGRFFMWYIEDYLEVSYPQRSIDIENGFIPDCNIFLLNELCKMQLIYLARCKKSLEMKINLNDWFYLLLLQERITEFVKQKIINAIGLLSKSLNKIFIDKYVNSGNRDRFARNLNIILKIDIAEIEGTIDSISKFSEVTA
eukprot:NODE_278_length_11936_cov_0.473644.p4 type:complete len:305 gc:universal NODE_278_length_11936_cov_0.473644:4708-3794(-)